MINCFWFRIILVSILDWKHFNPFRIWKFNNQGVFCVLQGLLCGKKHLMLGVRGYGGIGRRNRLKRKRIRCFWALGKPKWKLSNSEKHKVTLSQFKIENFERCRDSTGAIKIKLIKIESMENEIYFKFQENLLVHWTVRVQVPLSPYHNKISLLVKLRVTPSTVGNKKK